MHCNSNAMVEDKEYLAKTVEIKNNTINQLLEELRQTRELYHAYKQGHLNQQASLKAKVKHTQDKLSLVQNQAEKYQRAANKLSLELEQTLDRQNKAQENYQQHVQTLNHDLAQRHTLVDKTLMQNHILKERIVQLEKVCFRQQKQLENIIKQKEKEIIILSQEKIQKEYEYSQWKEQIMELVAQLQHKCAKKTKISSLQQKIKSNLLKF